MRLPAQKLLSYLVNLITERANAGDKALAFIPYRSSKV